MHNIVLNQPLIEPVSLDEVKIYLRIDADHENAMIEQFIRVSRRLIEEYTGRALITQTHRLFVNQEDCVDGCIVLPVAPFQGLASVIKVFEGNSEADLNSYRISKARPQARILLPHLYWPTTEMRIDYRCGYGDSALDVPDPIRQAMLLLIADLYENRPGEKPAMVLPGLVRALLAPYRILHVC